MPATLPDVSLSAAEIAQNPVWQLLARAGIDWTAGQARLVARHGLTRDRISQADHVVLPTDFPAFQDFIEPLAFRPNPQEHPALPLAYISGSFSQYGDVAANVMHLRHALEPYLGTPESSGVSNTIGWRWQHGRACLTLTGWPRALNRHYGQNDYHKREPKMIDACSVVIEPGYRLPLLPAEAHMLADLRPLLARNTAAPDDNRYSKTEAEYIRLSHMRFPLLKTHVAISADGSHLVCGTPTSFVLLPVADIARFEVVRMMPARFAGYSTLFAVMQTGLAACPEKFIALDSRDGADDFNADGPALAANLGRACVLQEYGTEN